MKKHIKIFGAALLASAAFCSCTDLLDEQPRDTIVPNYFDTPAGIEGGITSAYSDLRDLYRSEGPLAGQIAGTDEATRGSAASSGTPDVDAYSNGEVSSISPSTGPATTLWGMCFGPINTLNGVLEKGSALGISPAMLAEANFLRAFYYFTLVRNFGAVPLDLGSGQLKFNTTPSVSSVRNPVDEVYTAILNDLDIAIRDLPDMPSAARSTAVTKAAAYHIRAKAFLTYGWLLENASTFPQAFNKPLGSLQGSSITSEQAFQKAWDDADYLIRNQATFGKALRTYYEEVHALDGEYGSESLFLVDRTNDPIYGETDINGNTGGKTSVLNMLITAYYQNYSYSTKVSPTLRTIEDGRPWRRLAPTYETIVYTYADKTNDSRYDATFQKVWYVSNPAAVGQLGEAGKPIALGDTAFYMPGYDEYTDRPNYRVWRPRQMTRDMYPTVKKWLDGPGHIIENATGNGTSRPFVVAKLSETHLIRAEAALKLGKPNNDVREDILVLRRRAALRSTNTAEQNGAAVAAIEAATPATIDIVYIMMERSRELWGEFLRWNDLQRTRLLESPDIKGLTTYQIVDANGEPADRENPPLGTFQRRVMARHYLRPIPQNQFDRMDEASREGYQNEGY